jgi:Na+/H+-dicarboxylate symporter
VVLFSLITGAANISPEKLGKVGIKIFGFYFLSMLLAGAIGLIIANAADLGSGFALNAGPAAKSVNLASPKVSEILVGIIPVNPFESLASNNMLQIIFFAILFGLALAFVKTNKKTKKAGEAAFSFFEGSAEAMYKVVRWVMQYAPIGVFALIANVFADNGPAVLKPLAKFILLVYAAFALQLFGVFNLILRFFKLNFLKFLELAREPITTAFVTRTSNGTLPVTMDAAENKMGIHKSVYSFSLPLGATINMNGISIQQTMSVIFMAGIAGVHLDFAQQAVLLLTVVLSSIGAAGIPSGSMIMLVMVLNTVGLSFDNPVIAASYAMLLGVDPVLDMGQTCLNVTGDIVGTAVVAKSEGEMDLRKWK